jgi:hypothetical protein
MHKKLLFKITYFSWAKSSNNTKEEILDLKMYRTYMKYIYIYIERERENIYENF